MGLDEMNKKIKMENVQDKIFCYFVIGLGLDENTENSTERLVIIFLGNFTCILTLFTIFFLFVCLLADDECM